MELYSSYPVCLRGIYRINLVCIFARRNSVTRFGVLTVVPVKHPVFCDVLPSSLVETYWKFRCICSIAQRALHWVIFVYRVRVKHFMPLLSLGLYTGGVRDKRLTFMFEPYSCLTVRDVSAGHILRKVVNGSDAVSGCQLV